MLSSYQMFGKDYFGLSQRIDDLFSSSEDDISNNFMCEAGKALEQIQVADHISKLGNAFASKLRAEVGESSAELTCTTDQSSTMFSSSTPSKNIWSMTPQEGELIFNPLSTWCQSVSPIVHRETPSPNSFKTSFVDTLNESLQSVQSNESTEQADACSITPVSWNGNNVAQSWNVFNGTQAKPQHVSRPSKLNANDLKGAYERLMNLKSPTMQQQVSTSPTNAHKSLPSQYAIDQNGNSPIISASYCGFCRNNGESEQIYKQHKLKDNLGRVTCPVLRVYVCPICQATGDEAHTLKYCPRSSKDEMNLFKVHETARTSAGKRRPLSLKRM